MNWEESDVVTSDRIKDFVAGLGDPAVYIKTDVVYSGRPIQWRGAHHTYRPAAVWVTGHSDYGITPTIHARLASLSRHWFAVNKEVDSPAVTSLPLGITNDCADSPMHRILGNTAVMYEVSREPQVFTNLVYLNINVATYPAERSRVFAMFHGKPWVTTDAPVMTLDGRRQFMRRLRAHKFALCPRGNGVDTHRFWEALYMGCIPIVRRELAMREFEDLPVCWVNDWAEVTEAFLVAEFERIKAATWNMEKLTMRYWKKRITDKLAELDATAAVTPA